MNKKKLIQSKKIIEDLISRNLIKKSSIQEADFFIEKAKNSLETASRLLDLIEEEKLCAEMWVINSSYYSMFFAVTAILAKKGNKINSNIGIHKLTYNALIYYFYNQIQENYIEEYKEAIENAEELLGISETQTEELIENYNFELEKRKIFTYFMGRKAEISKAKTSFQRAKDFYLTIEQIYYKL